MRIPLVLALIAVPATALAQQAPTDRAATDLAPVADAQAQTGQPPQRIRSVSLQRGEACPKPSMANEVVVCTTIPDPYRIPKPLRQLAPSAANQSWVNRTATMDRIGRQAAGLPDTCSPVGSGGQSGCALSWNNTYAAQRRADKNAAASVPGGAE
ncbi:MAG TPA: hypothetical protein VFQ57_08715 [Sphingomonas sp.]|jgi:hypothetical protein|nr:hypothetical protein [Sphingomonas sp.]